MKGCIDRGREEGERCKGGVSTLAVREGGMKANIDKLRRKREETVEGDGLKGRRKR